MAKLEPVQVVRAHIQTPAKVSFTTPEGVMFDVGIVRFERLDKHLWIRVEKPYIEQSTDEGYVEFFLKYPQSTIYLVSLGFGTEGAYRDTGWGAEDELILERIGP